MWLFIVWYNLLENTFSINKHTLWLVWRAPRNTTGNTRSAWDRARVWRDTSGLRIYVMTRKVIPVRIFYDGNVDTFLCRLKIKNYHNFPLASLLYT